MENITLQPKGGHRIDVEKNEIFLTDASSERVQVDRDGNIRIEDRTFSIPLVDGKTTAAGAEEALLVAWMMQRAILAGARRFSVQQVFNDGREPQ